MRYRRVGEAGHEVPVACTGRSLFDLRPLTADVDGAFLAGVNHDAVRHAIGQGRLPLVEGGERRRVGPPVARPGKVVCIGLNYRDHASETGAQPPEGSTA